MFSKARVSIPGFFLPEPLQSDASRTRPPYMRYLAVASSFPAGSV
jgi:hypothetical protein